MYCRRAAGDVHGTHVLVQYIVLWAKHAGRGDVPRLRSPPSRWTGSPTPAMPSASASDSCRTSTGLRLSRWPADTSVSTVDFLVVRRATYHTHVWRGHPCVGVTHVWRGHSHVGVTHVCRGQFTYTLLTCGGDIHVWMLLTCGGDIHVWELHVEGTFTCWSYSHVEGTFMCGS